MWLVVQKSAHGAPSHFECFHCPDKPLEPEPEDSSGVSNAFDGMKRLTCDGEHIGQDRVVI